MTERIRTLIIEDEPRSRSYLTSLLAEFCPEVQLVGEADSVVTGQEAILTHAPDLVFLDIKMPHGTGFDLLKNVPKTDFEVVFTTAHDEYAIKAIKFSALDYLLKPIDIDELKEAVRKIQKKRQGGSVNFQAQFENFMRNWKGTDRKQAQVALPTQEGILFVPVGDIIRCEADGSYTRIHQRNGEHLLISKNLKEIESLLSDFGFHRIHKSHLVNLMHVARYIKGKGGEVVLQDGSKVEVSVRRKDHFLEKLLHR